VAYLDSSGRPLFADKENYVLAALVTNERHWVYIDNSMKQIKLKHFPNLANEEVEIHAKDMLNHDGIFQYLSWDEIYSIFDDVFNFIHDAKTEIKIIAILVEKSRIYKKKIDVEVWAHRLLFERINHFIERQNRLLIKAQYPHEYGIMLTDSEGVQKDLKLRLRLLEMLKRGTFYSHLDYLFEDPMFIDSKWRNFSQLVDCIAYCIRKQFRDNTPSFHTPRWQRYFHQVESKFDCKMGGSYHNYGLKIFPNRNEEG
jgi:hypothetical protein